MYIYSTGPRFRHHTTHHGPMPAEIYQWLLNDIDKYCITVLIVIGLKGALKEGEMIFIYTILLNQRPANLSYPFLCILKPPSKTDFLKTSRCPSMDSVPLCFSSLQYTPKQLS